MTRAFEIGVSLALGGGVLAEAARVRREIIQLETATFAKSVSVQRLREAVNSEAGKSGAAPDKSVWLSQMTSVDLAEPVSRDELPPGLPIPIGNSGLHVSSPGLASMTGNKVVEPSNSILTTDKGDKRLSSAQSMPRTAVSPMIVDRGGQGVSEFSTTGSRSPLSPIATNGSAAAAHSPVQLQRVSEATPITVLKAAPARGNQLQSVTSGTSLADVRADSPVPKPPLSYATSESQHYQWATQPYLPTAIASSVTPNRPSAPRLSSPATSRGAQANAGSAADNASVGQEPESNPLKPKVVLPSETASRAGPAGDLQIQGDVFLDGAIVGRWMSRLLNREAQRASVGPTGFDTRRGRLMPGATVGG